MKLLTFLLFVSVASIAAKSYSQVTKLNMDLENVTVKQVFQEIEKNSEFIILYSEKSVDLDRKVNIEADNSSVDLILDKLFSGTKNYYEIKDRQIAIMARHVLEVPKGSNQKNSKPADQPQKKIITGKVKDEEGVPLPGVAVIVKGTTIGITTDVNGNYSLEVPDDAQSLVFSFVGMKSQEIAIGKQTQIDVTLEVEAIGLEEVVAVGYGTLSRSKVLGAVASIKSAEISQLPVGSIDEAIAGHISGVHIVTPGAPGNASQIKIRGISTITAGRNPLIVVDGYPMTEGSDLNAINPQDIESIEVLKDAASTAIYGSRGANGVIMVTTRTGKSEKVMFNFEGYTGFQQVLNPMEFMDAYQYAQMVKEARDWGYVSADPENRNYDDDTAARLSKGAAPRHLIPEGLDKYLAGTPGLTNNNWLDDVFQDGKIESYNLSVSGRNGETKWFVSGGYYNQEGLIIGSGYDRFSAKVNLETKLHEKIKFGINLTPSVSGQNSVIEGWTDSPMQQAILSEPFFTPFNDEGMLNISQQIRWHNNGGTDGALVENPVAIALQMKDEKNKFRLFGSSFLEIEILKGFSFKTLFGGDFDYTLREQFRPSTIGKYRTDASATKPWAKEQTKARKNIVSENTLNYAKQFDRHSLGLLAGYSYQRENYNSIYVDAPVLDSNDIPNVAGTSTTTTTKNIAEWVLISYFGRVQYDFDTRYLFSASIRRDGSSRFGANSKWGIFPSASAGWVISNEEFFPKESFIDNLKFRYSWGKTGNNQIGNYGSTAVLKPLNGYIDGNLANGQIPSTSPNADLSWETSITNNVGFDLGLFNRKLNIQVDYFVAETQDMLLDVPVPQHSGFTTSLQNIGKMRNKGFEFIVSTSDVKLGPVKWNASFNFSTVDNEVLALAPDQEQIIAGGTNITKVGSSIGEFYGYVVDGIYKSQAEIDASAQKNTSVKVGDFRIVDVSEDGKINDEDRTVIGSPLPDFTYGFNNRFSFNNFDFNVFIDGVEGVDVLSRTLRNATNGQGFSNQLTWYFENRWHPENNPDGFLQRPDYTQSSEQLRANVSSHYVTDASFLRIRNITLGYNLPSSVTSKIGVNSVRLYITAKNPIMITEFKGFNPEQSRTNPLDPSDTEGSYPQNKSFVFGVNLSF